MFCGGGVRGAALGSSGGAGSFGTAKCSDTSKPVLESVPFVFTIEELRVSSANGRRKAVSSCVEAAGMSERSSAFASTRIAFESGCGWLTTGAEARRLSE